MYQRIKTIREYKKLHQGDFAEAVGLRQGHLSKIEQGKGKVPPQVLGKIIEKWNVNPLWMLGVEGEDSTVLFNQAEQVVPKTELTKCTAQLIEKERELSAERLERIKAVNKIAELYQRIDESKNGNPGDSN